MRIVSIQEPLSVSSLKKSLDLFNRIYPKTEPVLVTSIELKFIGAELTFGGPLECFTVSTLYGNHWMIVDELYIDRGNRNIVKHAYSGIKR